MSRGRGRNLTGAGEKLLLSAEEFSEGKRGERSTLYIKLVVTFLQYLLFLPYITQNNNNNKRERSYQRVMQTKLHIKNETCTATDTPTNTPNHTHSNTSIHFLHIHTAIFHPPAMNTFSLTTASALILLLAAYCALDPFHHSSIADFPNFQTFPVDMPPFSQIPTLRDPHKLLRKSQIKFLNQLQGPESLAFDSLNRGPYTGVADGRVVFWTGEAWTTFAYTSANRSEEVCGWKESIMSYVENEHVCGRPLGLRFDKRSEDLYIADAYLGLLKVGPEGGLARRVVTEVEGVALRFTNDLDVDDDGNVYFTDSSSVYQRR